MHVNAYSFVIEFSRVYVFYMYTFFICIRIFICIPIPVSIGQRHVCIRADVIIV